MLKKDLRLSPARRLSFQAPPARRLFGVGRCILVDFFPKKNEASGVKALE